MNCWPSKTLSKKTLTLKTQLNWKFIKNQEEEKKKQAEIMYWES